MKSFSENDKFEFDLTERSVVMDVGAHCGNYAAIIHEKYGCTVHAYEPVPEFYNQCVRRFGGNQKIRLWPFALGNETRAVSIGVKGDMSGAFCAGPNTTEIVPMRDFVEVFDALHLPELDLLAINAEGAEFEILEIALTANIIARIRNLLVQFHACVPDFAQRHDAIRERIAATHDLVFDEPFCWTGWRIK